MSQKSRVTNNLLQGTESNQNVNVTLNQSKQVVLNDQNLTVIGFEQVGQDLVINFEDNQSLTIKGFFSGLNLDMMVTADDETGFQEIKLGDETLRPVDFVSAIFNELDSLQDIVVDDFENKDLVIEFNNTLNNEYGFFHEFIARLSDTDIGNFVSTKMDSQSGFVNLESSNTHPTAGKDFVTTNQNTAVTITDVLTNDIDIDGDALTVTDFTVLSGLGLVTQNNDGSFVFNPNGDFDNLHQYWRPPDHLLP